MAKRTKYFFNPKSLSFEKVSSNTRYIIWRSTGFVSLALVLGFVMAIFFARFLSGPRENQLRDENNRYRRQLGIINSHIKRLDARLAELVEKDKKIYRTIYEADPIEGGQAGSLPAEDLAEIRKMSDAQLVESIRSQIERISVALGNQDKSYDQLFALARNKDKMLSSIPAIQPVSNKELDRLASGYGYRIDPIYHTSKFHAGMDFTASVGTEVYATGDGVVKEIRRDEWGYGLHIIIDHGYGYSTLYAHLSRFAVKVRQKITRGMLIGYVGNTGKSTGPHLHYEVRKNGQPLNPAFFYYNDLSDADYARMLEKASQTTKSFD